MKEKSRQKWRARKLSKKIILLLKNQKEKNETQCNLPFFVIVNVNSHTNSFSTIMYKIYSLSFAFCFWYHNAASLCFISLWTHQYNIYWNFRKHVAVLVLFELYCGMNSELYFVTHENLASQSSFMSHWVSLLSSSNLISQLVYCLPRR